MEEDIKVLEDFCEVFRMTQKSIDKYEREDYGEIIGQNEIQAIENLIARNKELEEMLKHRIKYTNELEQDLYENASNYVIPKSKVRVLIEKYRAFGWHNKDDEYWANRILDGFEQLLQEGDK